MSTAAYLHTEAHRVAKLLEKNRRRIVFAESCTGGLVAASLARIPGISDWLCGSAVTYRDLTKHAWLGIPRPLLKSPGPVSEPVARKMAESVLKRTREADLAASITGHLGPGAPAGFDGRIFIAITERKGRGFETHTRSLAILPDSVIQGQKLRAQRQMAASLAVLFMVRSLLEAAQTPKERS